MCVLRFGFVLFWRAGYGFIDANVNLLFVLCIGKLSNSLNTCSCGAINKMIRSRMGEG